jgi:hypothetical protein
VKKNLSILLIEDDQVDQMALTASVTKQNLPYRVEIADSVADARRALAARSFDVILADYKLGDGTAFDLFDLFKDQVVIFTTGSGDEETAARALQMGVRDYLIKDPERKYLKLLPHRVEIVLRQWAAEQQLRDSEERYRDLIENTADLVQSVSPEGKILFVNRAWRETLGYTEADLPGLDLFQIIAPDCREHCGGLFQRLMRGENVGVVEVVFRARDGRRIELEGSVSVRLDLGRPVSTRGIFRDVTERKASVAALRQSEARLNLALTSAQMGVWNWDIMADRRHFDEQTCRLLGIDPAGFTGTAEEFFRVVHPGDLPALKAGLARTQAANLPYEPEYRVVWPDGTVHHIASRGRLVRDEAGRPVQISGILWYITARKQTEEALQKINLELTRSQTTQIKLFEDLKSEVGSRMRIEDALRDSEAFNRTLVENLPQNIFVKNRNSVFLMVNANCAGELNLTPSDFIGKDDYSFYPRQLADQYRADDLAVMTSGKIKEVEERHLVLGKERWVHTLKVPVRTPADEVTALLGIFWDVTEKRLAAEAVRASEENLSVTLNSIGDAVLATDAEGRVTRLNPVAEELTGWPIAEAAGRPVAEIFRILHEHTREPAVIPVTEVLETGRIVNLANHTVLIARDGTERPIADSAAPIRDREHRIIGVVLVFRDMSGEHARQRLLREHEEDLAAALESSPEAIGIVNTLTGCIEKPNAQAERLFGISRTALEKTTPAQLSPEFQPDGRPSRDAALEKMDDALRGGRPVFEWTHRNAQGRLIPCEVRLLALPAPRQCLVRFSVTDITERKAVEARLRDRETLLSSINTNLAGSAVCRLLLSPDGRLKCSYVSPNISELVGVNPADFLAHPELVFTRAMSEDLPAIQAANRHAFETGGDSSFTFRMMHPDGRVRWLHFRGHQIERLPDGTQVRDGVTTDITALKEAEAEIRRFNQELESIVEERSRALAESELRFRAMFESSIDGIIVGRANSVVLANPAFARMIGLDPADIPSDLVNAAVNSFVHPEDRDALLRRHHQRMAGADVESRYEIRLLRKDGTTILAEFHVSRFTVRDEPHALVICRDITERRQAERVLREKEFLLSQSQRIARIGSWSFDLTTRHLAWTNETYRLYGVSPETFTPTVELLMALVHPEDRSLLGGWIESAATGHPAGVHQFRVIRPDGATRILEGQGEVITSLGSKTALLIGTVQDITERRRAEASVLNSEARLAEAQRIAHLGSWEWDAATDTVVWSKELCAILEVDPTRPPPPVAEQDKLYTAESMRRMHAAIERGMRDGTPYEIELERMRSDGTSRWLLARGEPVSDAQGRIIGLRGTALDITERKQAENALHHSQERLQQVLQHSKTGLWDWDIRTNEVYFSPEWKSQIGYADDELPDRFEEWETRLHPEDHDRAIATTLAYVKNPAGEFENEFRLRHKNGAYVTILTRASVLKNERGESLRMFGLHLDITERKNAERQMLRAQRVESIGTLTGGIAHDLNNALAPILMSIELLKIQYPGESELIELTESSARRAGEMVRQLVTFARGTEGSRVSVQTRHLIREMEKIIRGSFPKDIVFRFHLPQNLPPVLGDATQLHQVLLNLCVNARDAMPGGGTLTIEGEAVELDAAFLTGSHATAAKPGPYAAIRVKDTGTGIPPEILDRIFDPFFTTKDPGKGTGLGLSTVLGIVKGHGGFLNVSSHPGRGSTFAIYLPSEAGGKEQAAVSGSGTLAAPAFQGSGETVLYVDDESALRDVARAVLKKLNFTPLTATDGSDALVQATEHRDALRAVITDLHMPHMDGLSLVRALRRMLPHLPVIVVSGRLEDHVTAELKRSGVTAILGKPFTQATLATALRGALHPPAPGTAPH